MYQFISESSTNSTASSTTNTPFRLEQSKMYFKAYPKYDFAYKVDDKHTGDHKEQHEHRDGHDTKSDYKVHVEHIVPHHHHHHHDDHHY
ncbi:hypothetical protein HF086_000467 [Spodoptera exigua]|uniref:Uncharacterized protein n=1 Tax=Spodoptera exigua TaxID=7107 RepID=A0A922SS19_SPOEX|nr:hypothetical protein HF086_000467 [Spodoptera exigua]